jgi:Xaa-Pro aminopeptidase
MKKPNRDFFEHNRNSVAGRLQGGLLVIAGYTGMQLTNDEAVPFRQEATFWWLSGIEFADWWLIIDAGRKKSWLVEPEIDDRHRLFEESLQREAAIERSGVDDVLSRDDAKTMLRQRAKAHPLVYTVGYPDHHDHFGFTLNPAPREMKELLARTFKSVRDFRLDITKLRAIKQPCELEWMQAAIDLTAKAITDVRNDLAKYQHEYQIEADLTHAFRYGGADGHAFEPIVSSGAGTATVHYFTKQRIRKGTPLMLDIGARVHNYAADITRTMAAGKPTKRLNEIHAAVQSVQKDIIHLLRPGLGVGEYQQKVDAIIKAKLVELRLMNEGDDDRYRQLMPHAISHGLGIDVHEALGRPQHFQPGMVLTVEPGIYLPDEKLGVRIEDDILITKTGHKNLSAKLPSDL